MAVVDLSRQSRIVFREGRFYREIRAPRSHGPSHQLEELEPTNGSLKVGPDGYVYFAGDPFPPGGQGTYKIGEVAHPENVRLYPGVVLDLMGSGQRRFRISYRYLATYRQTPNDPESSRILGDS